MPYHVVRGPVRASIYFEVAPSFLLEHQRFTFTHLFSKFSNDMYMAALPVPPKGVGTNTCLQLLIQNTSKSLTCLPAGFHSKMLRESYHVCLPALKYHESHTMSAAVSAPLIPTHHQSNTKVSTTSVVCGRLTDVSMPLRLNIPVISPGFLQRRTSIEELEL